jgi:hypothetical protein
MPPSMTLQPSPFLERLIRLLLPYFLGVCPDLDSARAEILETLASYGARTRSEMLSAAQIIAYGLSGLDALHEAKSAELSPSMRLRLRGCANNLNRSCQKNEQSLVKRLGSDLPQVHEPLSEPVNDIPETELQERIQEVHAKLEAYGIHLSGPHFARLPLATPASRQEPNEPTWGGAMKNALAPLGLPAEPAFAG